MKEVLQQIKPSLAEKKELQEIATAFIRKLSKKVKAKVFLGGSVAKGTWLREDADIDIFVAFPKEKNVGVTLKKALAPYKPEQVQGSRDYFRLSYEGYTLEVVPILHITRASQAKNITDISPLHTLWVKKHSTEKMRDDILLTKKLFQAHDLYGAESYIRGFSGYVLEILVIHYGSFKKLINAMKKWKQPQIIDTAKHHKDALFEINASKHGSLVVIDPVQPGRNAAAAVSEEQFEKAIRMAQKYVPSSKQFIKKTPTREQLESKKNNVVIEVVPLEGKRDVVGCKLDKIFHAIQRELTKYGFSVKKSEWYWNDTVLFSYTVHSTTLPKTATVSGPPAEMKEHAASFRKKYRKTKTVKGKLVATITNKVRNVEEVIKLIIKQPYIKERCKRVR
tara:strand:+ start:386 stop:1564 length:1179 start_codon:yes stop_codon:yes gene_type:complete